MPTSTHLPSTLPAANESEPGWHEDIASHYELLMRSIRERPWPRPAAIRYCRLYLLHTDAQPVRIKSMKAILLYMHRYHLPTVKLCLSQIKSGCYFTPLETAYLHTLHHSTKQHNLMSCIPGDVLMSGWLTSHNPMQEPSVLCYWHVSGTLPPYCYNGFHIEFIPPGQPPVSHCCVLHLLLARNEVSAQPVGGAMENGRLQQWCEHIFSSQVGTGSLSLSLPWWQTITHSPDSQWTGAQILREGTLFLSQCS